MPKDSSLARTVHDLGLAAWFGGSLMGASTLNRVAAHLSDPQERARVANLGWKRWTPVNLLAIGAYVAGSAMLSAANKGRLVGQKGVASVGLTKAVLTGITLAATAYARALGGRVMEAGDVAVRDGTTPDARTPPHVHRAQRRLSILQWAIPAHVAALIALNAKMGEQQRPKKVLAGMTRRAS